MLNLCSNIEFDFDAPNPTSPNSTAVYAEVQPNITAIFTILDKAPIEGSLDHVVEQTPLKEVADSLKDGVTGGLFVLVIPDPEHPGQTLIELTAIPESFREVDRWDVKPGDRYGPKGPAIYTAGKLHENLLLE